MVPLEITILYIMHNHFGCVCRRRETGVGRVRSVWLEFCADLGPEKLIAVVILVLLLSLYVAYIVTGYANQIDTRIPVDADRSEL